jgi:phosphate/sulfate permease
VDPHRLATKPRFKILPIRGRLLNYPFTFTSLSTSRYIKQYATALAFGTAAGGWRITRVVGKDFMRLQPVAHGFCVGKGF